MIRLLIILFLFSFPVCAKTLDTIGTKVPTACTNSIPPHCVYDESPIEIQRTAEKLDLERVIDGDTFVASGHVIRLWGIDAPERGDANYTAATWYLESVLNDKNLTCKFIEKDKYDRDVMHCFADNSDVGSMMVQTGMATDYQQYSNGYYKMEEAFAKREKYGIWKNASETVAPSPIACTMEAKLCPDGSSVSRTGPNCEFSPCPDVQNAPIASQPRYCCKHCSKGIPCGNSCISASKVCHQPPGCAC